MRQSLFRPKEHLRWSNAADAPVMVLWGDSIGTPTPGTTFDESQSLWGVLRQEFASQNSAGISWYNRSIGGARFDHIDDATLDDTGLTVPTWPDNPTVNTASDSWLDTVSALSPTTIFLALGINDGGTSGGLPIMVEAKFQSAMAKIIAALPQCDIVFLTNFVPNYYSTNSGVSGRANQMGRLFVQERIRQYAMANGFGVIDLGRIQTRMTAGFDPDVNYLTRGNNNDATGTTPVTLTTSERDFGALFSMPASASLWTSRIKVTLSAQGPNAASWVEIYDSSGSVAVEFVVLDTIQGRTETVSGVTTPTSGTVAFSVFVKGNTCRIEVNGAIVYDGQIERHGGEFAPVISFLDNRSQAVSAITDYYGRFFEVNPVITFPEMFGAVGVSNNVEGGNDQNHPNARGWAMIQEALKDVDLSLDRGRVSGVVDTLRALPALADDATYTLTTPFDDGTLELWCSNSGVYARIAYNAGSTARVVHGSILGANTTLAAVDTDLTGTTGTDTEFTISLKQGEFELENRRGTQIGTLRALFFGSRN